MTHFVVLRRSGPDWRDDLTLEEQSGWAAHAAYMDRLAADGRVLLGSPLHDEHRVVLVMQADDEASVRELLAADPWSGSHLEVDSVDGLTIRLRAP